MESQITVNPDTGLFEVSEESIDTTVSSNNAVNSSSSVTGQSDQTSEIENNTTYSIDDDIVPSGSYVQNEDGTLTLIEESQNGSDTITNDDTGTDLSDQTENAEDDSQSEDVANFDSDIMLTSVSPSTQSSYTVQSWQFNVAENRQIGDHYLIWAERTYYNNYSSYWHYYAAVGKDIVKDGDIYTYTDCELYDMYTYNDQTTYNMEETSGSVSGSAYLVYSDLYFDYCGSSSVVSIPFVLVGLLLIIIMLLIIALRRK